jgi:hypothetical protein
MPTPRAFSSIINVRFGSLADILARPTHVRFTPESGRRSANWVRFVIRGRGQTASPAANTGALAFPAA